MPVETFAADAWLFGTLNADPLLAGKVHDALAPQDSVPPYVVFQQQSGTDVLTANRSRVMANLLYVVRVIGQGASFAALKALAQRVDALLQRASGSNADGTVLSSHREEPMKRAYTEQGVAYREVVLTYRLFVQGV